MWKFLPLFFLALIVPAAPASAEAPLLPLTLLDSRTRPADSYTQGLFFHDGHLYESSGLYGQSAMSRLKFEKGRPPEPVHRETLAGQYFAEGSCVVENEVYLLTWRERTGFVLDAEDLSLKRWFKYEGEGWGLAFDGRRLWRSDGSARLHPHRPGDFAPDGDPLTVRDGSTEVALLNELEWDPLTGLLLANVYGSDFIAAIDLADGRVRFWLDGRPLRQAVLDDGLAPAANPLDNALNGLALDGESLWLTGKLWPRLYQVAWPPSRAKPCTPGRAEPCTPGN